MAYCKKCGKEISDYARKCEYCGEPVEVPTQSSNSVEDNGGFGWGLLGFCIPLVGLILFLVWKDEKPVTAKAAGMGALISVIVYIVFYVVVFAIAGASAFAY